VIGSLDDPDAHVLEDTLQCILEAGALISTIGVESRENRIKAKQRADDKQSPFIQRNLLRLLPTSRRRRPVEFLLKVAAVWPATTTSAIV